MVTMNHSRREFLTSLAAAGCVSVASAAPEPSAVDVGRQLFVDDVLTESNTLQRRFHRPAIHPASPVLKPETSLEIGNGVIPAASPFSDGVWYDPKDKLFKLWYIAGYDDGFALATSPDGIRWERPNLDVVPGTNRVMKTRVPPPGEPGFIRNGSTVWLDHDSKDPSQRFKMFAFFRRGDNQKRAKVPRPVPPDWDQPMAYTSPDGIHWSDGVRTGKCGDNSGMFYNPFRKMWVYNIRSFHSPYNRVRSIREHPDFLQGASWKEKDVKLWLHADELDVPDPELKFRPELYKVDAVAYESRMLAMLAFLMGPSTSDAAAAGVPKINDIQLAYSVDGIKFERPDRTPFLACSRKEGTWNRGYLHSAGGCCLVVGDELRFYFGGFSGISPKQGKNLYAGSSTGLAVLRRDGFASLTSDRAEGSFTTKPILFKGQYLFVNAAIKAGGELRAEVLDEQGQVIAPFTARNCNPVKGDRTRHAVAWKASDNLSKFAGKPVRLRFQVRGGDFYSWWVSPERNGASHGYVAAGGPGFTGSRDTTGA